MRGTSGVGVRGLLAVSLLLVCSGCGVLGWNEAKAGPPRTLYVDPGGDDTRDGVSPATAWRTLDRVSKEALRPGDRLLLTAGARYEGTLRIGNDDAGDPRRPVVVTSMGKPATIAPPAGPGIEIVDTGGVEIRNLVLVAGAASAQEVGLLAYAVDIKKRHEHLVVDGVDVSGFRLGIAVGATEGVAGWRGVTVMRSKVHGNRDGGLITYGATFDSARPVYALENVLVDSVEAYDNPGNPADAEHNSGSGIVLGGVAGGRVTRSQAYGNGAACPADEGPVGIWAYDSTRVVIEHNVSWGNRSAGADGGGFDLDQNVSDSVMQYNLSHGNAGPGFMLFSAAGNNAHTRNVVRYNVSDGDALGSTYYGGLTVIGDVSSSRLHNNTVRVATDPKNRVGTPAVRVEAPRAGVQLWANVLVNAGDGPLVLADRMSTDTTLRPRFVGNVYSGAGDLARWNGAAVAGIDGWRSQWGQEQEKGAATGVADTVRFVDPAAVTVELPAERQQATGLALHATSPGHSAAAPLPVEWTAESITDFAGNMVKVTTREPGAFAGS